jgi:hypothetical protein
MNPLCSTQPLALPATENLWSADGSFLIPSIDREVHLYTKILYTDNTVTTQMMCEHIF